jgi:uncharacterized protein YbaP (TraB family)
MKKKYFNSFTFIGLLLGLTSFLLKPAEKEPIQSSLLWKIEGNGIKNPSYLFGTMHLIEKEYFYFPTALDNIVKKSDVLVMEIAGIPDQMEVMQYLLLKEGTFFDYFSPVQKDSILSWAQEKMKMDEKMFTASFSRLKPFVLVQTATQMQFAGKTASYERTLEKIAMDKKIKIEGLETVADQMKIFDDLTKSQQAEMVMSGIRNEEKSIGQIKLMQQLYSRQNIDSLYNFIHDEGGVLAEEQHAFLDQRNINWIPKIKKHASKGKAFIAVGAGHLGGENGVIRLLENEGYKLTPVKI